MKRIVLISPYPFPGQKIGGGVERVTDTLMRELSKHAHVIVIAPGAIGDNDSTIADVRVIHLKRSRLPGSLAYWSIDALRLRWLIARLKPDIVHIQGAAAYGILLDQPYFVSVHGIPHLDAAYMGNGGYLKPVARYFRTKLISLIEKAGRARAKGIVLINQYVVQELPDVRRHPTINIANPVASIFLVFKNVPPRERNRLLSVGKICARKNILGLLQVFAEIAHELPNAKLTLCGSQADKNYVELCRRFARDNQIEDKIEWLGGLDAEQLALQYDRASLLLTVSHQETAPMAIAEAHIRGLPVAGPPEFGLKHMIVDRYNGYWLSCEKPAAWGQQVCEALAYPFAYDRIAVEARLAYDASKIVADTLAFYDSVD